MERNRRAALVAEARQSRAEGGHNRKLSPVQTIAAFQFHKKQSSHYHAIGAAGNQGDYRHRANTDGNKDEEKIISNVRQEARDSVQNKIESSA
jgi:hypothetical protein